MYLFGYVFKSVLSHKLKRTKEVSSRNRQNKLLKISTKARMSEEPQNCKDIIGERINVS